MKILVTGGTGFVGGYLSESLMRQGHEVQVLARHQSHTTWLQNMGVKIVTGDLSDRETVEKAARGCQQVYHLAGITSRLKGAAKDYYTINTDGTKNVAHAALKADVERLIYGSSVGVYGIISQAPANEQTPPKPNTPYRESKYLGEKVLLSYHQQEKLPVVIARLSNVVGARGLNWLGLAQAIANRRLRMLGTGDNYQNLVHVTDVVDGLLGCAQTPNILGETYIIAGTEQIKLKDLVQMLGKAIGVEWSGRSIPSWPFQMFFGLSQTIKNTSGWEVPGSHRYEMFLTSRIVDIAKARAELGYQPKVSAREGIQEVIAWYKEKGYL